MEIQDLGACGGDLGHMHLTKEGWMGMWLQAAGSWGGLNPFFLLVLR